MEQVGQDMGTSTIEPSPSHGWVEPWSASLFDASIEANEAVFAFIGSFRLCRG